MIFIMVNYDIWGVPKMVDIPKWMVYNGKFYSNADDLGGTPILGNLDFMGFH